MPLELLAFSSIGELRRKLDAGEVSAEQLARAAFAGLESEGRQHHLVAAMSLERALEEAVRADELIQSGGQTLLTGIPYGVKDQLAAVGMPTCWGSPVYESQQFDYDATVVQRLCREGAVLVAKLALMELGGAGGYRSASACASGPTSNPWNPDHWAGGSSGGSAAVVGAGLLPFALGGDALGSIILPAAFCGVTGLRPTYGAVSSFGSMPGSWSLGKVGVLSRSAVDCASVFQVIAGKDAKDPVSTDDSQKDLPPRPYRLGVLPAEAAQTDAVGELLDTALGVLRGLSMRVSDVRLPEHDYVDLAKRIRAGEAVAGHEELIRDPEMLSRVIDERQREGLRAFLDQPLSSFPRAVEERVRAREAVMTAFGGVDFLVTASVPTEAPPLEADLSDQPFRYSTHMAIGALAGLPGVSIPIGFGPAGLPVGMTIIGQPFADLGVLDVAKQYQDVTKWHLASPNAQVGHSLAGEVESITQ